MTRLVLSIFPGVDLMGRAFEQVFGDEICLVRGPDPIFGGDIHGWHVPAGMFWGIIGGPPCQAFSKLVHIVKAKGLQPKPNLIPEFERVVQEAQPEWFVMENVPKAPEPVIEGYIVKSLIYNNRWAPEGPEQNRERRFSFGTHDGRALVVDVGLFENPHTEMAVLASTSKQAAIARSQQELQNGTSRRLRTLRASLLPGSMPRRSVERCCELQGLPAEFLANAPFTAAGKYRVIGNGVPLPTGRAIASAVKRVFS